MHPLDQNRPANADHALEILRKLPRPLTGLDLQQITEWARRQRAERLLRK